MSNGANANIGANRIDPLPPASSPEVNAANNANARSAAAGVAPDGGAAANVADDHLRELRRDFDGLKDAVAAFISQATDRTVEAARGVASQVADQSSAAAGRGADLAAEAGEQAKGLAKELEHIARRNPLSAIAAAAALGMLIGMMGRRR